MRKDIEDLLASLDAFKRSPESVGLDLRLDLTMIILNHLKEKGCTQAELAEAAGMKDSQLSRLTHSTSNCTFDVAGRIAHAMGIRLSLVAVPPSSPKPKKRKVVGSRR